MVENVFWISLFLVFYVYAGYPLALAALGALRPRAVHKAPQTPRVTVLIAAYNEESLIAATVRNKLEQDYPGDRLEVIVVSDGSSDRTDAIVEGLGDSRVRLLRQEPRAGKTSALNLAVPRAQGEIIVFSDANSLYAPDALSHLVANFADPQVGYVTGKMIYSDIDGTTIGDGCTAYMTYENILRSIETAVGSVVGVDGGIDAMRKKLYRPLNPDQLPDFVQPLKVVEEGYRVVYDPEALLREPALKETSDEYRMRVRVSLRALWALFDMRRLLSFKVDPLFAWQLWSHKVLRYLCFLFLVAALSSNLLLVAEGAFFRATFLLQVVGYLAAGTMPALERRGVTFKWLNFARYFALLNLASAHAFGKFLLRRKQVIWIPRKG